MEEDARELLAAVNALCSGDDWRIADEAELAKYLHCDCADIAAALVRLEARRLIGLRYAEGGVYCLRALPAGREYAARAAEEARASRLRARSALRAAFAGGFAGAFFGAVMALLVSLLF